MSGLLCLSDREGIETVRALGEGVYKPIIGGLLELGLLPFSAYIGVVKRV